MQHYRHALPEMRASGLYYVPLIFSCYRRVHPEVVRIFELLSQLVIHAPFCVACAPPVGFF